MIKFVTKIQYTIKKRSLKIMVLSDREREKHVSDKKKWVCEFCSKPLTSKAG